MIDIRKKEKEKGEEMCQTRVKNILSSTEWNMCRRKQVKIAMKSAFSSMAFFPIHSSMSIA